MHIILTKVSAAAAAPRKKDICKCIGILTRNYHLLIYKKFV